MQAQKSFLVGLRITITVVTLDTVTSTVTNRVRGTFFAEKADTVTGSVTNRARGTPSAAKLVAVIGIAGVSLRRQAKRILVNWICLVT